MSPVSSSEILDPSMTGNTPIIVLELDNGGGSLHADKDFLLVVTRTGKEMCTGMLSRSNNFYGFFNTCTCTSIVTDYDIGLSKRNLTGPELD